MTNVKEDNRYEAAMVWFLLVLLGSIFWTACIGGLGKLFGWW